MSPAEVKKLNTIFIDQARGRAPVIAGIIPDTTDEAVTLGNLAKDEGVAALQVTPPHYLFQPGAEEIASYYDEIHRSTGLPIILYNVLPWGQVTPAGVERLLAADAICAVKQSGSNMHQVADMVYRFGKQIPVLSAVDDLLYPSFILGAHGTLSAIASVLPGQCRELFDAVQDGRHGVALEIHNKLLVIWRALEDMTGFPGRVKCAIELQGRAAGLTRRPLRNARPDEKAILERAFEEAGIPLTAAKHA